MDMVLDTINEILHREFPEFDFKSSGDYVSDGLLDSFGIVLLISELEKAFDIVIDPLDIVPKNFISAGAIKELAVKTMGK